MEIGLWKLALKNLNCGLENPWKGLEFKAKKVVGTLILLKNYLRYCFYIWFIASLGHKVSESYTYLWLQGCLLAAAVLFVTLVKVFLVLTTWEPFEILLFIFDVLLSWDITFQKHTLAFDFKTADFAAAGLFITLVKVCLLSLLLENQPFYICLWLPRDIIF